MWQCVPTVLDTWEAEAGGFLEPRNVREGSLHNTWKPAKLPEKKKREEKEVSKGGPVGRVWRREGTHIQCCLWWQRHSTGERDRQAPGGRWLASLACLTNRWPPGNPSSKPRVEDSWGASELCLLASTQPRTHRHMRKIAWKLSIRISKYEYEINKSKMYEVRIVMKI